MLVSALAFVSLVEGESCPAPVDVATRVRAILHLTPDQPLTEGFAVERHEAGLYVALRSADSTLIGERTLPTEGSCDELAQAAAVVLAAWLTDAHPDFASALPPAPPVDPAPATIEPAPPPPAPEPAPPAPEPAPSPRRAPPPPAPARPKRNGADLVGAVGGDLAGGALSPALMLGASYGASPRGFAVTARAIVTLPRDEPLDPGQVSWSRWPLQLGPSLRFATSSVALAATGGVSAAWLRLGGDSFDEVSDQSGLTWGGFGEVMLCGRGAPVTWVGALNAQFYPGNTEAYVSGLEQQWPLPQLSLTLVVGARFTP